MAEAYKRRQLLLRHEDGSPGGFIRIEQVGARCTVDVRAAGMPGEAKVMLLRPEDDTPYTLGTVQKGAGSFPTRPEEVEGFTQAALLRGDKLALVGGDGVDFPDVRKRLLQPKRTPRPAATVSAALSTSPLAERQAVPSAPTVPPAADNTLTAAKTDTSPSPQPVQASADGWAFTSRFTPGAPERITGRLLQDGRIAATLHGVAGVYAPEPPPGLTGFTWDGGYWVRVEAAN